MSQKSNLIIVGLATGFMPAALEEGAIFEAVSPVGQR
jgi:hypothetical protein